MKAKNYNEGGVSDQGYDISENDCPVCGTEQSLQHKDTHIRLKTVTTNWICAVCGSQGHEDFSIEFIGHTVTTEKSLENRDG